MYPPSDFRFLILVSRTWCNATAYCTNDRYSSTVLYSTVQVQTWYCTVLYYCSVQSSTSVAALPCCPAPYTRPGLFIWGNSLKFLKKAIWGGFHKLNEVKSEERFPLLLWTWLIRKWPKHFLCQVAQDLSYVCMESHAHMSWTRKLLQASSWK